MHGLAVLDWLTSMRTYPVNFPTNSPPSELLILPERRAEPFEVTDPEQARQRVARRAFPNGRRVDSEWAVVQ